MKINLLKTMVQPSNNLKSIGTKSTWNRFHNILFRLFDGMILHGWSTCNLIWLMRLRFCYISIIETWIIFFKMPMIDIEKLTPEGSLWVLFSDLRVWSICHISKCHVHAMLLHVTMLWCDMAGLILGLYPANETASQSNAVSHWLGANLESSLHCSHYSPMLLRTTVLKLIIKAWVNNYIKFHTVGCNYIYLQWYQMLAYIFICLSVLNNLPL